MDTIESISFVGRERKMSKQRRSETRRDLVLESIREFEAEKPPSYLRGKKREKFPDDVYERRSEIIPFTRPHLRVHRVISCCSEIYKLFHFGKNVASPSSFPQTWPTFFIENLR